MMYYYLNGRILGYMMAFPANNVYKISTFSGCVYGVVMSLRNRGMNDGSIYFPPDFL